MSEDELFEKEIEEAKSKAIKKCACDKIEDLWYCESCQEYHCKEYPECD